MRTQWEHLNVNDQGKQIRHWRWGAEGLGGWRWGWKQEGIGGGGAQGETNGLGRHFWDELVQWKLQGISKSEPSITHQKNFTQQRIETKTDAEAHS